MNNIWTTKWKKCLLWFSAYFSFVAFAVFGGYTIIKSEDEELKNTTKKAFIVTLIFTALSAFLSLFYNFGDFFDSFLSSAAYDFYDIFSNIVAIVKIVVFAVIIILELVKKEETSTVETVSTEENK